jgi:hypothetical protein
MQPSLVRVAPPLHVLCAPDVALLLTALCPHLHTVNTTYGHRKDTISAAAVRRPSAMLLLLLQRLAHVWWLSVLQHWDSWQQECHYWAHHCRALLAHIA